MTQLTAKTALLGLTIALLSALPAAADPVLKPTVVVRSAIVTAGDIFHDAGANAERGMFRAPAPGKSGNVSVEAIREAAKRVGIDNFTTSGIPSVNVARQGVPVTEATLVELMTGDLKRRGIVNEGVMTNIAFTTPLPVRHVASDAEPVTLLDLRYAPGSSTFKAKFRFAGYDGSVELGGRLDLMIEAPHLNTSLPAGAVLRAEDIEMRAVQLSFAENGGLSTLETLVGKALKRPAREGMMLRASDVTEPEVIKRSDVVTMFYNEGPLRLTVKGQALNAAAVGESVAVLNLVSKKIVHGIAADFGTVEMANPMMPRANIKS